MPSLLQSRNGRVIALYTLVLIAMVSVSKPEQDYSMVIRLGLFGAVMLPVFFSREYIIFSFTCFYAINSTSFCRLLPSDEYYYVILIILAFMLSPKSQESVHRMMKAFFCDYPILAA